MIEVKRIESPQVGIFHEKHGLIGRCMNEIEFTDIRVQIKKESAEGYYVIFNNEKIEIDKNGRMKEWPNGLYDQVTNLLMELL